MSRTYRSIHQGYLDYSNVENYIKNSKYILWCSRHSSIEDLIKEYNERTRDGRSWRGRRKKLLRYLSNNRKRSLNREQLKIIKNDPEAQENMIFSCDKHTKYLAWCVW